MGAQESQAGSRAGTQESQAGTQEESQEESQGSQVGPQAGRRRAWTGEAMHMTHAAYTAPRFHTARFGAAGLCAG
jgi:hypothetical protein